MQDAPFKGALEPPLVRLLPLLVDDPEGDVLVRRPGDEADDAGGAVGALGVSLNLVRRSLRGFEILLLLRSECSEGSQSSTPELFERMP